MDTLIPQELIEHLVKIGCSESFDDLEALGSIFPSARSGSFMRLRPEAWYQVADILSEQDVTWLIKALTRLESYNNYKAGSVSPVIWLFRRITNCDKHAELVNWILNNTENDYLPFGSSNHGAKSLDDYHRRCEEVVQRSRERQQVEQKRQQAAKTRKANEASQRLFGALKRKDRRAVAALLTRGANTHATNEHGQTVVEYAKSLGLDKWLEQSEP